MVNVITKIVVNIDKKESPTMKAVILFQKNKYKQQIIFIMQKNQNNFLKFPFKSLKKK